MFLKVRNKLFPFSRDVSNDSSKIKEIAAEIVKNYLDGHWKTVSSNNLIVQKLRGGLSNWLYKITIVPTQTSNDSHSHTVLLRFHDQNYSKFAFDKTITDTLVSMLMSERKLGPKLHGVFPGGKIEEYLDARSLHVDELANPKFSTPIAIKLSQIHALNVPISKNPNVIFDLMSKWLTELGREWNELKQKDLSYQFLMDKFKSFDLATEIDWLRQHLRSLNSPIVFCHNDLQEGNILVTDNSTNSGECNLIFIDYEYCSYNYRGFDLANHFIEYTMNYKTKEYPYFAIDSTAYPSVEQQVNFIRTYTTSYNQLINSKEINSLDKLSGSISDVAISSTEAKILFEISHFRLLSHLLWGIWAARHSQTGIEFGYWDYSIARLNAYFEVKEEVLNLKDTKNKKAFN